MLIDTIITAKAWIAVSSLMQISLLFGLANPAHMLVANLPGSSRLANHESMERAHLMVTSALYP